MKIPLSVCRPILLCVALVSLWPVAGHAQLKFVTNNGAITITGYGGTGAVVVPASTNGWPVTSIGANAFDGNVNVTSISLPNSITNLGNSAFYGCDLTNINIPGSVITMGPNVCADTPELVTVTLGYGLTSIGTNMFAQSTGMRSLVIPNSVTSIGPMAFDYTYLTNVVLSANLTSIGDQAFSSCYYLRNVYFLGDPPAFGVTIFEGVTGATAYYLPFNTGWTNTYAGIPAVPWNPPVPAAGITMYSNAPVVILPYLAESIGTHFVVQMTTNLASGIWVTVSNTVPFIGVQITNAPSPAYFRVQ